MRKIVVLAKQVPDTQNIGSEAMKEDGTINRAALPAIFNPEDLNALEMALSIKEKMECEVHVITMGPPSAIAVLKESLYRGADGVQLISDQKFAGADTLATSYVLAEAIRRLDDVFLVIAGRQAIDGDTAQVGPQVANLLGFNIVGFTSGLRSISPEGVEVDRDAELQTETLRAPFPLVLTVTHDANEPRFPSAQLMLKYFRANLKEGFSPSEQERAEAAGWIIPVQNRTSLELDEQKCGLKGSPTKVFSIKNITLTGKSLEIYPSAPHGVRDLVKELMKDYTEVSR